MRISKQNLDLRISLPYFYSSSGVIVDFITDFDMSEAVQTIHTFRGFHDFIFHLLIEFDLFFRSFQFIFLKRLLGFSFDWISILFRDLFWSFNNIFFRIIFCSFSYSGPLSFPSICSYNSLTFVLKHSNYIVFSLNMVNSFFNCNF